MGHNMINDKQIYSHFDGYNDFRLMIHSSGLFRIVTNQSLVPKNDMD
jgi:hypothetical protein